MGDDIVQLPCDTGPFTPCRMFEQGVGEGPFRGAVCLRGRPHMPGDARGRHGGAERGDQNGDDTDGGVGGVTRRGQRETDVRQHEQTAEQW